MVLFYTSSNPSKSSTTVTAQPLTWSRWSWKPSRPLGMRHGLTGTKVCEVSLSLFFSTNLRRQYTSGNAPKSLLPKPGPRSILHLAAVHPRHTQFSRPARKSTSLLCSRIIASLRSCTIFAYLPTRHLSSTSCSKELCLRTDRRKK